MLMGATAVKTAVVQNIQHRVDLTKKTMAFYERDESKDGVPNFNGNYPDLPKSIYIKSVERRGCDLILWSFYKLLRSIYIPWFYFMPSFFFFGQYITPFLLKE